MVKMANIWGIILNKFHLLKNLRALFIFLSLLCTFSDQSGNKSKTIAIRDVTRLTTGRIHGLYAPTTTQELQSIMLPTTDPIAIAGGRFSQGGHIWTNNGIVIDMQNLNRIIALDIDKKLITVEAGATWKQIQEHIDPHGLSIKVMQSYNDFTVGGSLSVNVHGRTINDGAIINTVESIHLILADGSLVAASREENSELFKAAIGGYGAVGIITQATLSLTDNCAIEKSEAIMPLKNYPAYFDAIIKNDKNVVFHNANLYTDCFDKVSSITWYKTNKDCIIPNAFQSNSIFSLNFIALQMARTLPIIQKIRPAGDAVKNTEQVISRNYEMSSSVCTVAPVIHLITTPILQEYFIPCDQLLTFIEKLKQVVRAYKINMLNVSIRYICQDTESIMAYAQPKECFSLVCYINIKKSTKGMKKAERWTQELIEHALVCGGTYYLPYQLYATKDQFERAYPQANLLRAIKEKYDPTYRFKNSFLEKYII